LLAFIVGALGLSTFEPLPATAASNTITVVDSTGDVGRYSSLALDPSGNPVISYYNYTFVSDTVHGYGPFVWPIGDLKLVHCGDPFCTGPETPIVPDSTSDTLTRSFTTEDTGLRTWLQLDSAGNPVVVYEHAHHFIPSNPFPPPSFPTGVAASYTLKVLRCNDTGCLGGDDDPVSVDLAASSGLKRHPAFVLTDDSPTIVSAQWEVLQVMRCLDPICSTGDVSSPEGIQPSDWDYSLALDSAGLPVVSYLGFVGIQPDITLLYCNDPACAGGDEVITRVAQLPVGNLDSFATSLALDDSERPTIAYYSDEAGALRIARCGDPVCVNGNTIVSVGAGGAHNSLRLDAQGNPVISYHSFGALHVYRCGNPTCTSGNTISVADAGGDVGAYTSLVLDASGNPVVSYYDAANGNLKLLRCGDPTCNGVPAPPVHILQEPASPTPTPASVGGLSYQGESRGGPSAYLLLASIGAAVLVAVAGWFVVTQARTR